MVGWLRRFGEPGGAHLFLRAVSVLVVVLLVILWGVVHVILTMNSIKLFNLQLHGVRSTGTVVSIRSVPQRKSPPAYYAKIAFVAGGDRHVEEIEGKYAEGDEVPIIYVADDPSVVDSESHIVPLQRGAVAVVVMFLVEIAGVLIWLRKRRSG